MKWSGTSFFFFLSFLFLLIFFPCFICFVLFVFFFMLIIFLEIYFAIVYSLRANLSRAALA